MHLNNGIGSSTFILTGAIQLTDEKEKAKY